MPRRSPALLLTLLTLSLTLAPPVARAGDAEYWLEIPDHIEIEVGYLLGFGGRSAACTDDVDAMAPAAGPGPADPPADLNAGCIGGRSEASIQEPLLLPAGLDIAAYGFPVRRLGIGARLRLDLLPPHQAVREPGPTGSVLLGIGPMLRLGTPPDEDGSALQVRIEPHFLLAFGQLSPITGHAAWFDELGLVDGGGFSTAHLGAMLAGTLELAPWDRIGLSLGAWITVLAPQAGGPQSGRKARPAQPTALSYDGQLGQFVDRVESAREQPDIIEGQRFDFGIQGGPFFPLRGRNIAIGPLLAIGYRFQSLRFKDRWDQSWCYDGENAMSDWTGCPVIEDFQRRKTYSTKVESFVVRIGVRVRIGAGGE